MQHIHRRQILVCRLILLCLVSALHGCMTMRLDEQTWLEARGPNFTVKSRLGEKETVALLEDLELFRRVVLELSNAATLDSPVPTSIYVFAGRYDFGQIEAETNVAGEYLGDLRDNIVIMREGKGMDSRTILQHEYAHFAMRTASAAAIPRWYNEGFAEYWHGRAQKTDAPARRADLLKRAREHYVKSWKLDDGLPETYAMYGSSFLLEGERPEKALDMLEVAESLLPSDLSIRLMVAAAHLAVGQPSEAIERARSVEAWSHPGSETAQAARELIEAREAALSSAPSEEP